MSAERGNILVVDDKPANLQLLIAMLKEQGYRPRPVTSGALALRAALASPPDLVLLDIMMPGMDGYEVCERFKKAPTLKNIPILFISALSEPLDKLRAFSVGGVDYITKPFEFTEVMARVQTHLRLQAAIRAEKELVEKTLGGAIRALMKGLAITAPQAFRQGSEIRRLSGALARALKLPDVWRFDLAGSLAQLGCVAVPAEVVNKVYAGEPLTSDEAEVWAAHPETGQSLLTDIPRLEEIAEMIGAQATVGADVKADDDVVRVGAAILKLIVAFNLRVSRGETAVKALTALSKLQHHPLFMIRALRALTVKVEGPAFESQLLSLRQLKPKMTLEQDVKTADGMLLVCRGQALDEALLTRLRNFSAVGIKEPIAVRVRLLEEDAP